MKVGIIGAGRIGGTLARGLTGAGHTVLVGVRGGAAFDGAEVADVPTAAAFGEAVILAVPFGGVPDLGRELGGLLAGRVVIDATNPFPDRDGKMAEDALRHGSGMATADLLPGARVAKAFNTLMWTDLGQQGGRGFAMAIAGDDAGALQAAATLVEGMGFEPVVAGGLAATRRFDSGRPAYGTPMRAPELRGALDQAGDA